MGGNGVMELFNVEEAYLCTPLNSYPLVVLGNLGSSSFGCSD
jgi:hypothetical protein